MQNLYRGNRGDRVRNIQKALNLLMRRNPPLQVTGVFDGATEARLREFQGSVPGLKVDGIYGPNTDAALAKAYSRASATRSAQKAPSQMSRAEVLDEIRKHSRDFDSLKRLLGTSGLANLVSFGIKTTNIVKFLQTVGVLDTLVKGLYTSTSSVGLTAGLNTLGSGAITGTAAAGVGWMVAGSAVIAGNLLFLAKCALTINSIYDNAQKAYAMRSIAYTITAWAFGRRQVAGSSVITSHANEKAAYQKAWNAAQQQTLQQLGGKKIAGLSPADFRQAIQAAYDNNAGAFCRDLMRSMASSVPGKANRDAWKSHLGSSNFAVLYPN